MNRLDACEGNADFDPAVFCSCKELEWYGCYGSGAKYNKYTVPESTSHPAKMSFELLERIFKHLESMNLLTHDSFGRQVDRELHVQTDLTGEVLVIALCTAKAGVGVLEFHGGYS